MSQDPPEIKNIEPEAPAPEVLTAQADDMMVTSDQSADPSTVVKNEVRAKRITYRPSHKATFVGLTVVVVILIANAVVIAFVMKSQADATNSNSKETVTISSDVLNKLGVNRNPVGGANTELVVGPNARFNSKVVMGGDVNISGQLNLNSKFSASDASLTKLEAGNTSLSQLNVNGDGTISTLNLRKDLNVVGATKLQGQLTVNQLVTINNNMNVAGSLAVGGTLSVRTFQASSLTSDTTLTIGGHIITRGNAPGVNAGGGVGSNGTVSISGNDAAGTVAVNAGVGAGNGVLATVIFQNQYGATPHVVVTAVGRGVDGLYINRTSTGFSIGVSGAMSPGGFAFDYIVMQ